MAAADDIARWLSIGDSGSPSGEPVEAAVLTRIDHLPIHLEEIRGAVLRRLETSKVFLDLIE